jgi:cysteinyl-tRNA synthetase
MATKYLGETFDIHGGGLENMFPHHECEIAQSEAATGKPFARYWIHNNMVTVDGVKMGKSLGNFRTIRDLLARHSPEAIRVFLLSTHYRSPTNYTEEAITAAATGLARLTHCSAALIDLARQGPAGDDPEMAALCADTTQALTAALDDDLDTPGAIARLYDFVTAVNRRLTAGPLPAAGARAALDLLRLWAGDLLGILAEPTATQGDVDLAPIMDLIIELRKDLKAAKQFALADKIRDRLKAAGLILEDTRDGTRWRKA